MFINVKFGLYSTSCMHSRPINFCELPDGDGIERLYV